MKIQLIDYGGRCPERAHANDAGADVFSPRGCSDPTGRFARCLWDLDFWFLMDMRVCIS